MFRDRRRVHFIYFIIDFFLISFSFYLSYKFNPDSVPQDLLGFKSYFPVFAFWGTSLIFFLNNYRLYSTDRSLDVIQEWWMVSKCVLFSAILAGLFIFIIKIIIFSRLVFIESILLLLFSLSFWRTLKRIYARYLVRQGHWNYNVLIVGAGKIGSQLVEQITSNPNLGINIVGFLDDAKTSACNGFKVLGKIADLEDIARKHFIDEIYVTIPSERKVTSEIVLKGAKLKRTVRVVAEHFDLPFRQVKLDYIGLMPLVTYLEREYHRSEHFIKRFLDLIISGGILILLFPLLMAIAFLIKLDSPGPVFYLGKRCGKKGRVFNFYKFRSMVALADNYKEELRHKSEVQGPIFKIRNDPRITSIGRLLRKYSLDEIPQLINVLKGDMSLVGPRPFPVEESEKIENKYLARLNINPGITGLAQIYGRSNLPFRHWVRWDIWYINNWSLGLDLRILWRTIPVVLRGEGAY